MAPHARRAWSAPIRALVSLGCIGRTRKQERLGVVLLGCAIAVAACSDPEFAEADGGASVTAPTAPGTKPGCSPGAGSAWSCKSIAECAKGCGTSMDCIDTCAAKGCASAQEIFGKNRQCVMASCLLSCTSGMNAGCLACAKQKCSTYAACQDHTCPPVDCSAKADDPAAASADGGAPAPAATPPTSCWQVVECAGLCIPFLPGCPEGCRAKACPAAQAAYDRLIGCAQKSCVSWSNVLCWAAHFSSCAGCRADRCAQENDACVKTSC